MFIAKVKRVLLDKKCCKRHEIDIEATKYYLEMQSQTVQKIGNLTDGSAADGFGVSMPGGFEVNENSHKRDKNKRQTEQSNYNGNPPSL